MFSTRSALLCLALTWTSCGSTSRCDQTCQSGCCDSAGVCHSGTTDTQCGTRGQTCSPCGLGRVCTLGQCIQAGSAGAGMSGGGSAGSAGGGTASAGGTAAAGGTAMDAGSNGGGNVVDAGAGSDGGTTRCSSDFDCGAGLVCERSSGTCVAGQPCSIDTECQSDDPSAKCYRFSRQCVCDSRQGTGTCRLRRGPCEACRADIECGADAVVFGPPEGAGSGRCRVTGQGMFCRYQRVGTCPCGTVDDGTGFCAPSSNSCAQVGCELDAHCPSSKQCQLRPDAGSCAGTCG